MPHIEAELSAEETNAVLVKQAGRNRVTLALLVAFVLGVLALSVWHIGAEVQSQGAAVQGHAASV